MSIQNMPPEEKKWHWLFEAALLLRGMNGVIEVVVGVFIIYTDKLVLNKLFFYLAKGELIEDPKDRILTIVTNSLLHLSTGTKIFAAIYILTHGILNIFLSIQLYRERIWAYRATLIIMGLFAIYQIYRISIYHSTTLIVLTTIDILFMALLWHEYRYRISLEKKLILD